MGLCGAMRVGVVWSKGISRIGYAADLVDESLGSAGSSAMEAEATAIVAGCEYVLSSITLRHHVSMSSYPTSLGMVLVECRMLLRPMINLLIA